MVTLKDIADRCGVSISAVSLAINKPHKISREQKDKILKVAHELGYFVNKQPTIKKILLVFSNFHNTFFGDYYNRVIYGILENLYKEKVAIQILDDFDKVDYSEVYENNGIIFVGKTPQAFIDRALEFRMPFVLCGHPDSEEKHFSLRFDIERGIAELMDYIISCGHKKIGLIIRDSSQERDEINELIMNAYKNGLSENKIPFNPKLIGSCQYSNLHTIETALNKLFDQKPTVIMCADDHFAYISYRLLKKWGTNIPQDMSITGFDGVDFPEYIEVPQPELTTVFTDQILLGREAIVLLKKIIFNPTLEQKLHVLPIRLHIGSSVSRLR